MVPRSRTTHVWPCQGQIHMRNSRWSHFLQLFDVQNSGACCFPRVSNCCLICRAPQVKINAILALSILRKYHWKKRSGIRKQSHYIVGFQTGLLYFPGSVKWTIASSSGSRTSKALGSTSKIFTWSDSPVAGPTETVMEQECCPFEECCVEMTKPPNWPLKALKTIISNLPMTMSLNVIL